MSTTADPRKATESLRDQAARCRRLARGVTEWQVSRTLAQLATEFEERADALEAAETSAEVEGFNYG